MSMQAVEIWWEIFDLLDTAGDEGKLVAVNSKGEVKVRAQHLQAAESTWPP